MEELEKVTGDFGGVSGIVYCGACHLLFGLEEVVLKEMTLEIYDQCPRCEDFLNQPPELSAEEVLLMIRKSGAVLWEGALRKVEEARG